MDELSGHISATPNPRNYAERQNLDKSNFFCERGFPTEKPSPTIENRSPCIKDFQKQCDTACQCQRGCYTKCEKFQKCGWPPNRAMQIVWVVGTHMNALWTVLPENFFDDVNHETTCISGVQCKGKPPAPIWLTRCWGHFKVHHQYTATGKLQSSYTVRCCHWLGTDSVTPARFTFHWKVWDQCAWGCRAGSYQTHLHWNDWSLGFHPKTITGTGGAFCMFHPKIR